MSNPNGIVNLWQRPGAAPPLPPPPPLHRGVPPVPPQLNTMQQVPQGTRQTPLPPAPAGPMSWWGKFLELSQNVSTLVQLNRRDPTYFPWLDFPPDGQSFDFTGVIAVPAINTETEVLVVPIEKGWDGAVLDISNVYLGPVGSIDYAVPSIIWRIYIDRRPVNGYSRIITTFGTTEFPRNISPILVNSGQTLRYTVTILDAALPAAGNFIYCQFGGRTWPHRKA